MPGPGRPFKKGQGGRPKGSKNKRTVELKERLEELGADPIAVLVELMGSSEDEKIRTDCAKTLTGYLYPRLKSVELDVKADVLVLEPKL